jgi:hypothetical protein
MTVGPRSQGPPNATRTSWPVTIVFVLTWTCIALAVLIFVVETPHKPDAMAAVFSGMIGSGYYLAWRSGHLSPKRSPKS